MLSQQIKTILHERPLTDEKLKHLFEDFMAQHEHACRQLLHETGTELMVHKDTTDSRKLWGFDFTIESTPIQWLAYFRGIQPKDLVMLLYKHDPEIMPQWDIIFKELQTQKDDMLEKESHIFQKHRINSNGIMIIATSSPYGQNCAFNKYCFSPGKNIKENFVQNLMLLSTYNIGLPDGPRETLENTFQYNTPDKCLHITYIAGRLFGNYLLHPQSGLILKTSTKKKIYNSLFYFYQQTKYN